MNRTRFKNCVVDIFSYKVKKGHQKKRLAKVCQDYITLKKAETK